MLDQDTKLLAADADPNVREIIQLCTKAEGWLCDCAQDGISALKQLRRNTYNLVILEAELPEVSGYIVCRHLRKSANDYIIKPFYPRELVARIKNLLYIWGNTARSSNIIKAGNISLNLNSHQATVDGREVKLTPKEFDLLLFFMRNQHQAFSRDSLLELVWGQDFFGTDRTVDTHVKSLRSKILPCQNILTVWGYGYKFEV